MKVPHRVQVPENFAAWVAKPDSVLGGASGRSAAHRWLEGT
ncbi:hypothetical protein PV416_38850 [Streptomyces ipomoeae]|nr:hypothetical protein [Streptomyces ipomoeae]MDX2699332.1 hypothetical protein [Streptomyces ipomoeae]MDX2826871.1 hypothetical protein [Streptomyces ipomoeae]MDX2841797.1 hypothetical protein [Streptomyces ipomoeae]MDX2879608.1 hypothetical protein [Streptomyces ipomoeae]